MSSIGVRLRKERNRLKLSQPQLAEHVGASKGTIIAWEKGTTSPTAVQLSVLFGIGFDTHFIITGEGIQTSSAEFEVRDGDSTYGASLSLSSLGDLQRDLVTQLISALSEKPQPGYSAEAVRKMVMTVQEIMLEERMQLTPEEVADAVINCLQQAARPDRDGVSRQLHVVK